MPGHCRGGAAAAVTVLVLLVLVVPLAGCATSGSGSAERPQVSLSVAPTRTLPSPSRSPDRTDQPTEAPTLEPSASKTAAPSRTATPSGATSPSQSAGASTSAAEGDEASADDGVPPWLLWMLAALVAAAAVAVPLLVVRSRRRRLWREQLASARAEVAWLAREFLPQLRASGSLERIAGGWEVGLPRVAALEDQLTVLESSTENVDDAASARALRDAVRTARGRVDALTAGVAQDTWALDLDETVAVLESALAPSAETH